MSRAAFEEVAARLAAETGFPASWIVSGMMDVANILRRRAIREPLPLDVAQIFSMLVRQRAETEPGSLRRAVLSLDGLIRAAGGKVGAVSVVDGNVEFTLVPGSAGNPATRPVTSGPTGALGALLAAPARRQRGAAARRS